MQIVAQSSQAPDTTWCEINGTDTVYVGQVVKHTGTGVAPLGLASGASDATGEGIPFGIIVGTNDVDEGTFDSTFKAVSATGVITQAAQSAIATSRRGNGGTFAKGDPQRLVQVALIDPTTLIKAPIWSGPVSGAAINVQTVTTGSNDGLSYTANAADVAGLVSLSTSFGRSGANSGLYRITSDTSTTSITSVRAFPKNISIGDKFVRINLRTNGLSRTQFNAESIWIDNDAALTADYYSIIVKSLDLTIPGEEYVIFKFTTDHFNAVT